MYEIMVGKTCLVWKTTSQHFLSSATSLHTCGCCWVYWELAIA